MERIIAIDENTRINIIPLNFTLQYKIKTRNNRTKWNVGQYYSNFESLYREYVNDTPSCTIQVKESFEKLIETVETAESNLRKAIKKNTQKIIYIGKDAKITITPKEHLLQYRIKSRNNRIAWKTDGSFPDLITLSKEYLNNAPYRTIQGTEGFEKLIEVIKTAETNFCKAIEKNNQ